MDILKPNIITINGISYRINSCRVKSPFDNNFPQAYIEHDPEYPDDIKSCDHDDIEISQNKHGFFTFSYHVPCTFFGRLIGVKGKTLKRLEKETDTTINIPKPGMEGDIVITSIKKGNVVAAKNRIDSIVVSARSRMPPTHFLAFPLTNEEFKQGFLRFKQEVLEACPGIDEDYFKSAEKFHLTVTVMTLCSDQERNEAIKTLSLCKTDVIEPFLKAPLKVKVCGLDYFNDDPSAVDVLYAKAYSDETNDVLKPFAQAIRQYFYSKDLVWNNDEIRVHATLMQPTEKKIDARKIIEMFSDFYFGEGTIESLDLCARFTPSDSSYYHVTSKVDIRVQ